MSGKENKLIIQESWKDYGEEAAEGTKALSQSDDKFDRAEEKFEESHAEENMFEAARAEEKASRAQSQRARNLAEYTTEMAKDTKGEEEE